MSSSFMIEKKLISTPSVILAARLQFSIENLHLDSVAFEGREEVTFVFVQPRVLVLLQVQTRQAASQQICLLVGSRSLSWL